MSNDPEQDQTPNPEGGDDDERVPEEEVTEVEGWTPSVTLEVKETVVTGEEEEETVFTQRSKLLRYVTYMLILTKLLLDGWQMKAHLSVQLLQNIVFKIAI